MEIKRRAFPPAPAGRPLRRTPPVPDFCLGCRDCSGYCAELAELLWLPEAILGSEPRP